MSSGGSETLKKLAEDQASPNNGQNISSESHKSTENVDKHKSSKTSNESQGSCYWFV